MENNLTFLNFQEQNEKRNGISFPECRYWKPVDWSNALAGECGELCNLVKKEKRDGVDNREKIGKEIADIITYCSLIASKYDLLLESLVRQKFNEVSERVDSSIKL